jgi:nucleoside phosphorylase
MATPPATRDEFEVALVCSLPLEYDAVSLLFDQFWDENGDQYGRAPGDVNTYTTGRFGNFDVVLVLLANTGNISAASATASLRSSYPGLRLVVLTGICGAVPTSDAGEEILLGDVIISKTVIQYDYGRQYSDDFVPKDTTEDSLGRPDKNIRSLVAILETARERERIEERAAVLLEQIQDFAAKKTRRLNADTYQYPGATNDKLFEASYRHKHHNSTQCLCEQCHKYSDPVCEESRSLACDVLGCDERHVVRRQRLEANRLLEQEERTKEAQIPFVFIGRFGSSDKLLQSGEYRDLIAKRYGVLAFEMEGAGVWDELPCIIVKGVCNYADSHMNDRWQNFAAAAAASVAKGLVERYTKTDKSVMIQIREQIEKMMENKESSECLKDLHQTDPRDDKTRIQRTKGNLLKDSYRWVIGHNDFKRWRDNPQYRLLWIKGDPGKGKTMLLCGIIDEIESSATMHCLSYFFCQASDIRLSNATAVLRGLIYMIVVQRPLLISHVREKYDKSGKKLFDDSNAWEALSKILMAILNDTRLNDVILIVDALDECVEGLPLLLELLSQASSSSQAKWIVSSRNWPLIEENLDTAMQGIRLCLELNESSVSAAVQAYIKHKVQELTEKKGYDIATQQAVEQHLILNAHGTFLWVALVCQELGDPKVRKRHTLSKLKTLYPPGLDALYQRMMENIRDSLDAEVCRQILAMVSVVYRPITLAELSQLLDSHDDYENDDLWDIIGFCGSFLTIRDNVIYLIHQSAKDFLLDKASDQILASGIGYQHYTIFSRSLEVLTKALQRDMYDLRFPGFPIELVSRPNSDQLAPVAYSCIYWIDHFSDSECLQALAPKERPQSEDYITKFFEGRYLYWLEALSLLRGMSNGLLAIQKLKVSRNPIVTTSRSMTYLRYERRTSKRRSLPYCSKMHIDSSFQTNER